MKNNQKDKNIVGIFVWGGALLLLIGLVVWNTFSNNSMSKTTREVEQLELFTEYVDRQIDSYDATGKSTEETQTDMLRIISDARSMYGGTDATDAYAFELTNKVNGLQAGSSFDLIGSLKSLLGGLDIVGFVSNLLGGSSNSAAKTLTLASTTVCNSVADSKFCLDGSSSSLSANVYVTDPNSSNWVVLVHPFMTSGSIIYSTIGSMYEAQGYNVLAPDLRGFGNSDGSVAMGYLESLDVYDWIKDLNANYGDRYGVSVAPNNIIVHGISLGGATTIQLATNPDMAAAKGGPYTKTLTQLNVKGFVDDCGYTSMSGIITGMLSGGDISSITSLFDSFGIDVEGFLGNLKGKLGGLGISGFGGFDTSKFSGVQGLTDKFGELYGAVDSASSNSSVSSGTSNVLEQYLGNADFSTILDKYGNYFGHNNYFGSGSGFGSGNGFGSSSGSDSVTDWWKNYTGGSTSNWGNTDWSNFFGGSLYGTSSNGGSKVTFVKNSLLSGDGNFLDGIIGTVLMNVIGVGLTEENYDYYSDSFAEGRKFPDNAKVLIIHGTADTTVPHSNADVVAANAGNRLFYQWNAKGKPHAFVIMGSDKDRYANLVGEFTACVEGKGCNVTQIN